MRNALSSAGEGSPWVPRNGMTQFCSSWAHPIRHRLPGFAAGADSRPGEQMDPSAEDGVGLPTALAQDPAAPHQAAPHPVAVPQQRSPAPGTSPENPRTPEAPRTPEDPQTPGGPQTPGD